MAKPVLWVVFGVYNVGESLRDFTRGVEKLQAHLRKQMIVKPLAIDDDTNGRDRDILRKSRIKTIRHRTNKGVAQGLLTALSHVAKEAAESVYMSWLDSDGEHDPMALAAGIDRLLRERNIDVVLSQIHYREDHLSPIDHKFNQFMGAVQGEIILGTGRWFAHNCPGCWVTRTAFLAQLVPLYRKYMSFFKQKTGADMRWGEDMTFLMLAKHLGATISDEGVTMSRVQAPNRTLEKILRQASNNTNHLLLYPEFFRSL